MEIYLIDIETNEIKNTYTNVVEWAENFVEFTNGGYRSKIYCDIESEYFTNKELLEDAEKLNEELAKEREKSEEIYT